MKAKFKNQQMVLIAVLVAIVIVMTFTPLGYLRVNIIDITTIHVVMILAAIILGLKGGLVVGTAWGISNFILAMMRGTPEVLWFMNPLISILPRIVAGALTALYFILLSRLLLKKGNVSYTVTVMLTAILGTITHTVLVLTSVVLFSGQPIAALNIIFSVAMLINLVFESILSAIVVPAVCFPLYSMVTKQLEYSKATLKARKSRQDTKEQ